MCSKQLGRRWILSWVPTMRAAIIVVVLAAFGVPGLWAQEAPLPPGALTEWIIREPEEIVAWLAVDVRDIATALPAGTRYLTIGELAQRGIPWALAYLGAHPSHAEWGVSFFEVVRAGTFAIDGVTPDWPVNGAAALWAVRVERDEANRPPLTAPAFVMLDFWIPDSAYVQMMRAKRHYAEYGSVALALHEGQWHGTVEAADLSVDARCAPSPSAETSEGSGGMQAFYPPATSSDADLLIVTFAGHRIQECATEVAWAFRGAHPLAKTVMIGPPSFQAGYTLRGAAYHR